MIFCASTKFHNSSLPQVLYAQILSFLSYVDFSVWDFLFTTAKLSPNRHEYAAFYHFYILSASDIVQKTKYYFGNISQEVEQQLELLAGRGYFFYVLFLQPLWNSFKLTPPSSMDDLNKLLLAAAKSAVTDTTNNVVQRVQRLVMESSSKNYLRTLYFAIKMGNGKIVLPDRDARELVSRGVAYLRHEDPIVFGPKTFTIAEETLEPVRCRSEPNKKWKEPNSTVDVTGSTAKVEIVEHLLIKYIEAAFPLQSDPVNDPIFIYSKEALMHMAAFARQGSCDKEKVTEKIVAHIIQRVCVVGKNPLSVLCNVAPAISKEFPKGSHQLRPGSIALTATPTFGVCGEWDDFEHNGECPAIEFFTQPMESRLYFNQNAFGPDISFYASSIPVCGQIKSKKGEMNWSQFTDAVDVCTCLSISY